MKKAVLMLLTLIIAVPGKAQYRKFSFQQPKMGSLFNIVIYSRDSAMAANAAGQVYRLIDTLNLIYSDYLPESELNRLCASAGNNDGLKVSPELFDIVQASYRASELSWGSFDITMGPLVKLWRKARREKLLPHPDSLRAARNLVGYRLIELDSTRKTITLKKAGMQLDLGGIAKGETAQRAYARLGDLGFPHALVDAGGDVVAGSVPEGVEGWRVAMNIPGSEDILSGYLLLINQAVTTSGDLYQHVEISNRRYSHIISPFTGQALSNSRNVTVISRYGVDADWLTKACSVLPVKKALRLLNRFPLAEAQIGVLKNGKPVFSRSPGFNKYVESP
jgi:thiamine biosynthesis lipoprotein